LSHDVVVLFDALLDIQVADRVILLNSLLDVQSLDNGAGGFEDVEDRRLSEAAELKAG